MTSDVKVTSATPFIDIYLISAFNLFDDLSFIIFYFTVKVENQLYVLFIASVVELDASYVTLIVNEYVADNGFKLSSVTVTDTLNSPRFEKVGFSQ